jgi:hypothetical protein
MGWSPSGFGIRSSAGAGGMGVEGLQIAGGRQLQIGRTQNLDATGLGRPASAGWLSEVPSHWAVHWDARLGGRPHLSLRHSSLAPTILTLGGVEDFDRLYLPRQEARLR